MDAKTAIAKSDWMLADRSGFESQWSEIRTYIARIAASIRGTETPGARRGGEILDNTAEGVSEMLAATIIGELANPAEFWFGIETENEHLMRLEEVAFWLDDSQHRLYRIFRNPNSQWSVTLKKWVKEVVDFGTATAPILDQPGKGIRFRHVPVGETCLGQDADGIVDTHFRRFKLTADQAFKEWGADAGEKVAKAANSDDAGKAYQEFEFLRAVMPMREPDSAGRRFHSTWINVTEKHIIAERGFFDFPYMVGRWDTSGNEAYGRGPGHRALADVKMLQRATKSKIRAAERTIAPTLMVPDDGIIGPVTMADNGINIFRSDLLSGRQPPIQAVNTGARVDIAEEFIRDIRDLIDRAYYGHLLRMPREPRMLDAQFLEITEERARVMGPVLGPMYDQALGPTVERALMILVRAGATLPVPAALGGQNIKATFKSPFAQARQVSETRAIARFYTINAPLFERKPDAMDNIDDDEALRLSGEGLGVPRGIWRDPDAVAARKSVV